MSDHCPSCGLPPLVQHITTGDYVTPERAAQMMTAHLRNPLVDPQLGDAYLYTFPKGAPVSIHVVHRRDPWVWFAGPGVAIRSASVESFVATLAMAKAVCMNDEGELGLWPEPQS